MRRCCSGRITEMRRHDRQRFAKLVSEFIDSCGFEP
jgi:hypothetical protein